MTSSRPGARLTRIRLPAGKSAASSARTRFSSVGTGSRLSRFSAMGERRITPPRRRRTSLALLLQLALQFARLAGRASALDDDLVEKPSLPGVEGRDEHVIAVVADFRI